MITTSEYSLGVDRLMETPMESLSQLICKLANNSRLRASALGYALLWIPLDYCQIENGQDLFHAILTEI